MASLYNFDSYRPPLMTHGSIQSYQVKGTKYPLAWVGFLSPSNPHSPPELYTDDQNNHCKKRL